VLSLDPVTFFNKANTLMEDNPPSAADAEILEKLAAVHVGPGMEFDASVLTGDIQANWREMLQGLRPKLAAEGMKFSKQLGQWSYFGAPIGDFGSGICLPCAGCHCRTWGEYGGNRTVPQDGKGRRRESFDG